jgi:hypothetical protein
MRKTLVALAAALFVLTSGTAAFAGQHQPCLDCGTPPPPWVHPGTWPSTTIPEATTTTTVEAPTTTQAPAEEPEAPTTTMAPSAPAPGDVVAASEASAVRRPVVVVAVPTFTG